MKIWVAAESAQQSTPDVMTAFNKCVEAVLVMLLT